MNLAGTIRFNVVAFIMLSLMTERIVDATSCGRYSVYFDKIGQCVDFEWCLYKFYSESKSWFEAKAICEQGNMNLAKITDGSQQSYLSSLIGVLAKMYHDPPSTWWLGAYRDNAGNARWENDCSSVDSTYVTDPGPGNCFLFDGNTKFVPGTCTAERPFLCQASTLDTDTCFYPVASIFASFYEPGKMFHVANLNECFQQCATETMCVGFRLRTKCSLMTMTGNSYTKGGTQKQLYKRDLLRTEDTEVTPSITQLQDLCYSPAFSSDDTPLMSTVFTAVDLEETPNPTDYASPTTVIGTATLEPSFTETSAVETPPGSTTPLTNVPTTINLAETSKPTAAERTATASATCSSCSCINPTKVNQKELDESLSKLTEQLYVNPKELSSYKRSLISAPDDRQSAASIGYVGVLVLCVVPGLIILLDMGRLIREFKQFISRLRNANRPEPNDTAIELT